MAYNIEWYIENQVIYARMVGNVSIEEYRTLLQTSALMIDNVEVGEVHIINDVTHLNEMPNFLQLVRAIPKSPQPQMGWMIIVGETSPLKRFWGELFSRISPIKYKRLDKMEQALEFLQREDPNIAWQNVKQQLLTENWPQLHEAE
ncbi:MAG: hypothetical protein R3E39_18515 [Anaerolineae bacterium]